MEEGSLEQKCHNLEVKLKRTEDERNTAVSENDELQSKLVSASEKRSHCEAKLIENKRDLLKLNDEVQRLEAVCCSNEDRLSSVHDKVSELCGLKQSLQRLYDETASIKDELHSLKNRYNVATKLELQTQEQLYESRLMHLEAVLEEMRQSETQFLRLAEETNILKDQVDYLRELSVTTMKSEAADPTSLSLPLRNTIMTSTTAAATTTSTSTTNNNEHLKTSLYQSLYKSLDKDDQLFLTSILPSQSMMISNDKREETAVETEHHGTEDDNYLLVQGKLKVTSQKSKGEERKKADAIVEIMTKMWILLFD